MKKPIAIYKHNSETRNFIDKLEVFNYPTKFVGVTTDILGNEISRADFYEKDGDKDLYRVCEYFGFSLNEKIS